MANSEPRPLTVTVPVDASGPAATRRPTSKDMASPCRYVTGLGTEVWALSINSLPPPVTLRSPAAPSRPTAM